MKKSEFEMSERRMYETGSIIFHPESISAMIVRNIATAERAGVTWEPEESGVLWENSDRFKQRVTADGRLWAIFDEDQGWVELNNPSPMERELARRLLAEHQASSAARQGFETGRRVARDLFDRERVTDGGTFWVVDPETGKRELPVDALRELELRREGWVDVSPDAELNGEEIAQEKQHVTDGSPCWCEPETESPWHDEVQRRLKALEDFAEGLPLAIFAAYLKAKEKKPDKTS